MRTAICARFAASATKLKSRRKGDVVSAALCCGCGGGGSCCCGGADVGALDCVDVDWELKYVCWPFEGPFRDGDESGASILADSYDKVEVMMMLVEPCA